MLGYMQEVCSALDTVQFMHCLLQLSLYLRILLAVCSGSA